MSVLDHYISVRSPICNEYSLNGPKLLNAVLPVLVLDSSDSLFVVNVSVLSALILISGCSWLVSSNVILKLFAVPRGSRAQSCMVSLKKYKTPLDMRERTAVNE